MKQKHKMQARSCRKMVTAGFLESTDGYLFVRCGGKHFALSEQQRNTPNRRNCDQSVDNSADNRALPAENPANDVKLEKPDGAPIDAADDNQY